MGHKIAAGVDRVGEAVASVIGVDDSMFQDVIDNMTDEQMEAAIAVNEEREKEYRDAGIIHDNIVPTEEPDALDAVISSTKQILLNIGINLDDPEENKVTGSQNGDAIDLEHGGNSSNSSNNETAGDSKSVELIPTANTSSNSNTPSNSSTNPVVSSPNSSVDNGVKLDEIDLVA
eukprot:gene28995-35962_t